MTGSGMLEERLLHGVLFDGIEELWKSRISLYFGRAGVLGVDGTAEEIGDGIRIKPVD